MQQRRYMDNRRWLCLSRAQYARSCGISSLVSCWNYLFSTLGTGNLPPLSQEEALIRLGICKADGKYFGDIQFGAFTGNITLIKWFNKLCKIYEREGRAYFHWKMSGQGKSKKNNIIILAIGVDEKTALQKLLDGLKSENHSFIYHCYDHYFCPMGFEITPSNPADAYKKLEEIEPHEQEPWILIGEPSKCHPVFHIRRWKEISKDILLANPFYFDQRKPEKGIQERKGERFKTGKKAGSSIHCILGFQKVNNYKNQLVYKKNGDTILKNIPENNCKELDDQEEFDDEEEENDIENLDQ